MGGGRRDQRSDADEEGGGLMHGRAIFTVSNCYEEDVGGQLT